MTDNETLIQEFQATAELYGKNLSIVGADTLLRDLSKYPTKAVISAIEKCRRELKTFPTVADVILRIDDGRPGAEEAWAMIPKDEQGSVVWTDEMTGAFGIVRELLADGDSIAARMAFKEIYLKLVNEARDFGWPVKWSPSLGHDPSGREKVLLDAAKRGRISQNQVFGLSHGKPGKIPGIDGDRLLPSMPK